MFKQFILSIIFILSSLQATEITLHIPCDNNKPYVYCVDNQPRGVIISVLQSLFDKLNDYTVKFDITERNITLDELNFTKSGALEMLTPLAQKEMPNETNIEYTQPIIAINNILLKLLLSEINKTKEPDNNKTTTLMETVGNIYRIGFISFPEQKDLIKQMNLALKIMLNAYEIQLFFIKHVKDYLNNDKKKVIHIGLYNWGEGMVSEKIDGYGLIPEIITASLQEKNIEAQYQFFDYYYLYMLTKWGKICASGPWLNIDDRKSYMYYSDNLFTTSTYLYYNKKRFEKGITYHQFSDLSNYKIGGVTGMYYEKKFTENKLMRYTSYSTLQNAIKGLFRNEVDIILEESNRFEKTLGSDFSTKVKSIAFHPSPLFTKGNYLIFSKRCEDSKALKEQFNSGLRKIKENGTLEKLFRKYNVPTEKIDLKP